MLVRELRHSGLRAGLTALSLGAGLTLSLGAGLIFATSVAAPQEHLSRKDRHFMTETVQGDISEVKMGQLAQQKGQTDRVKQFGKTLEQDHSKHLQQARQIASQNGLSVPSEPNTMQRSMYQKLSSLSADRFDSAFARDMVNDHEKDLGKYRKEAESGSSVADFAKQTVPVLEKHLQLAQSLSSDGRK